MQIYIPLEGSRSNLVQTAWALLGLIHAGQVFFYLIIDPIHIKLKVKYLYITITTYITTNFEISIFRFLILLYRQK